MFTFFLVFNTVHVDTIFYQYFFLFYIQIFFSFYLLHFTLEIETSC